MKTRLLFWFAPLLFSSLCVAQGSARLPPEVSSAISDAKKDCSEASKLEKGFLTRRDINGDGFEDFILDYSKFRCGDGTTLSCGTAGCLTQVFVSLPGGGYRKVLDENVQDLTFKKVKGRPAMVLFLHGTACGKSGAEACRATLFWNGEKFSAAH